MIDSTLRNQILEMMQKSRPEKVGDLINLVGTRSPGDLKHARSLILEMVGGGEIPVKKEMEPSRFQRFLSRHGLLDALINKYTREPIIISFAVLLFVEGISWFILLFMVGSQNEFIATARLVVLGLDLLWAPGFSMTLMWYSFKSAVLDFSKLGGLNGEKRGDQSNNIGMVTRIGYSVTYSIGLVILVGFLLGVIGLGFDVRIMKLIFSLIECYSIITVSRQIIKLHDPYKVM